MRLEVCRLSNKLDNLYAHINALKAVNKSDMFITKEQAMSLFLSSRKWKLGHIILVVELYSE